MMEEVGAAFWARLNTAKSHDSKVKEECDSIETERCGFATGAR